MRRKIGAVLALVLAIAAAYLLIANWQLRRWLLRQSAQLGCSLEYQSAKATTPGVFRVAGARLTQCSDGRWSGRVVRGEARVALRSLLAGPLQPLRVELEVDTLRFGSFTLEGALHLVVETRERVATAELRTAELSLRQDGRALASSSHVRLDAEIPLGKSAPLGTAEIMLRALSSTPLALATDGPVGGSVRWHLDTRVPRLHAEQGVVRTAAWRLREQLVQATLELGHASCSSTGCSGGGRLLLQGKDAQVLLEQLRAPEALSFALSGLKNAPFTLSSNVQFADGNWTFEDLEVRTDEATLSGTAAIRGSDRAGTLRVVYRGVSLGVQFSNAQSNVVFDPPEGWPRSGT
jgi:hypothetical protein